MLYTLRGARPRDLRQRWDAQEAQEYVNKAAEDKKRQSATTAPAPNREREAKGRAEKANQEEVPGDRKTEGVQTIDARDIVGEERQTRAPDGAFQNKISMTIQRTKWSFLMLQKTQAQRKEDKYKNPNYRIFVPAMYFLDPDNFDEHVLRGVNAAATFAGPPHDRKMYQRPLQEIGVQRGRKENCRRTMYLAPALQEPNDELRTLLQNAGFHIPTVEGFLRGERLNVKGTHSLDFVAMFPRGKRSSLVPFWLQSCFPRIEEYRKTATEPTRSSYAELNTVCSGFAAI